MVINPKGMHRAKLVESIDVLNKRIKTQEEFLDEQRYQLQKRFHTIEFLEGELKEREHQKDTIETLRMENESMVARAAGFETQIKELNADSATYRGRIEHLEGELKEREHRIRTIEADYSQESLGNQHLLDKLKQELYNEQIKSTAYMTVIRELHNH